jgi:hypothetical protein
MDAGLRAVRPSDTQADPERAWPPESEMPLAGPAIQRAYAAFALYLDMLYVLQGAEKCDYEHIVIYACVAEATLRPHINGLSVDLDVPAYSGAISRLLVADRVGLPRETVRRRISAMIADGLLVRKGRDLVAIRPMRFKSRDQDICAAVERYKQRVGTAAATTPKLRSARTSSDAR